jgi:hypothetical protein
VAFSPFAFILKRTPFHVGQKGILTTKHTHMSNTLGEWTGGREDLGGEFPSVLVCGSGKSGKSTVMFELTQKIACSHWTVYCTTDVAASFWQDKLGSQGTVIQNPSEELNHKFRILGLEPTGVIIEDDVWSKLMGQGPLLESYLGNARHFKVSVVAACQYPKMLPTSLYCQFGTIVVTKAGQPSADVLYQRSGLDVPKADFLQTMLQVVTGGDRLVVCRGGELKVFHRPVLA